MLLGGIVLVTMGIGFFAAWRIKQMYHPEPGSGLHAVMRISYFAGWGFAIILGLLALAGARNLLALYGH